MSITRIPRALVALGMGLACLGCNGGTVLQTQELGPDGTLVTSADLRSITRTEVSAVSDFGRVKPTAVTCAEPSPDVAEAVAERFQLDSEAAAEVAGQGGGSLALAVARERAEAIAQMTERLATIQLLRDGMYRACEAYANGALPKTEYALILSRYDDTMVTLLLGELVAGNFGRPLARLGGTASDDIGRLKLLKVMATDAAAGGAAIAASFERYGASLAYRDTKVAGTLEQMQRNYLHDINSDVVETACLSVLSETPEGGRPVLAEHCTRDVLPKLQEARSRLLKGLIAGAEARSKTGAFDRREAVTAGAGRNLLIKSVQKTLKEAGYKVGPVDGVYGTQTVAAIRDFEKEHPDAPKYADDPWVFAIGVQKITGQ